MPGENPEPLGDRAQSLLRTHVVGFGQVGTEVVFRLKKRLSAMKLANDELLLRPEAVWHSTNVFRFLAIPRAIPENLDYLFPSRSLTGADRGLLDPATELSSLEEGHDAIKGAVQDQLNDVFDQNQFKQRTGLKSVPNLAEVIYVFSMDEWDDMQLGEILPHLGLHQKQRNQRVSPHAVVFSQRTVEDRDRFQQLKELVHAVRVMGCDGIIRPTEMNVVDLLTSYINIVLQLDPATQIDPLDRSLSPGIRGVGIAELDYPREQLLKDAVLCNLAHPALGVEDDFGAGFKVYGYRFEAFFNGNLKERDPEEQHPILLNPEDEPTQGNPDHPFQQARLRDLVLPDVSRVWPIGGARMADDVQAHTDLMVRTLSNALLDSGMNRKVKEFTHIRNFRQKVIERWHDQIASLHLLLNMDLMRGTEQAASRASVFIQEEWQRFTDRVFLQAKQSVDDVEKLNLHHGELIWQLLVRGIRDLRENGFGNLRSAQKELNPNSGEYAGARAVSSAQLTSAIDRVPYMSSVLLRAVVLVVVMILLFGPAFQLVAGWIDLPDSVPTWAFGVPLTLLLLFGYWRIFRRPITYLHSCLVTYLANLQAAHERELKALELAHVTNFYYSCVSYLRDNYAVSPGFFHRLQQRMEADRLGLSLEDDLELVGSTPIEKYYLNRYKVFTRLQNRLKRLRETVKESQVRVLVLHRSDTDYQETVQALAKALDNYAEVLGEFPELLKAQDEIPFWSDSLVQALSEDPTLEDRLNEYFDTLIRVVGNELGYQLVNHFMEFNSLFSYMDYTGYQVDTDMFSHLGVLCEPTFRSSPVDKGTMHVLANDSMFFELHPTNRLSLILDKNTLAFMQQTDFLELETMTWEGDDAADQD